MSALPRLSLIELAKEEMKFSAGHFTIFSATERERLHGHNFTVSASFLAEVGDNGMCFDYGDYKAVLREICSEWNEYFILPTLSPHLRIEHDETHVRAIFNGEAIPFLKSDVLELPIVNATLEEFARLILMRLCGDTQALAEHKVCAITVKVGSGPGQTANATWSAEMDAPVRTDG